MIRRTAAAGLVLAFASVGLLTACGPNSPAAPAGKPDDAQVQQMQKAVDDADSAAAQADDDSTKDN